MTIFPILETYWDERIEEIVDTGVVIGYQVIGANDVLLGQGETIKEAEEMALATIYPYEF